MITVDWEEVAKRAVDEGASNVHGVGVVELSINPPEGEEMDQLSREALAHGLHLADGIDGRLVAIALAHEIG